MEQNDARQTTAHFEAALYEDAKQAFKDIINKHGNDLYVIGFYHSGGFSAVAPLFNTDWARKTAQEELAGHDIPLLEYTVKWNPSEYLSQHDEGDGFDHSSQKIQELEGSFLESDKELEERWRHTLQAMERVLIRLDREGLFSDGIERDRLTLSIATYDETEQDQFDRIKRLNPESVLVRVHMEFDALISERNRIEREVLEAFESD
ncbi:MAG: DUF4303 domain-containing protein [Pseudomonadales bacterium]|nr:DUF4303 domain-containing protein [Pseudomonadales bacterium]